MSIRAACCLTGASPVVFNGSILENASRGDQIMPERPIDQLSLRDMFSNAEWLIRDLIEHLRQSFQTRARALAELVRPEKTPAERDEITDTAVRSQVAELLKSDDYSQTLFEKLDRYLAAIDERSHDALSGR